jgi:hypothetical protein
MLHHLSIPAADPQHVAATLVELFQGSMTAFGPYPNAYIAWVGDEYGTGIEVFPLGTELLPDEGQSSAQFHHNPRTSRFGATHAALSVSPTKDEIFALARREGWRALELSRGQFRVIEFWIENQVMLELLTEEMTREYIQATAVLRTARVRHE